MRTKALLLTAALTAVGAASMNAQVYSANAVGYVNLSLPAGYSIIANPLNGTNNNLNTILPLAEANDFTTIFRWNPSIQNYRDAIIYELGAGGWGTSDADPNALVLNPGEGFWIQPEGPTPLNVTFVGEVPQGDLSAPIAGGMRYTIAGSPVPQALPLGSTGEAGTLEFPADDFDTVFRWNAAIQQYRDASIYEVGAGWGSADPTVTPAGPVINVGEGFWVFKEEPARPWTRTFSVN